MARLTMKTGLIGVMFGIGFGHAATIEALPGSEKATPAAVETCRQKALDSAVDIYGLRSIGRAEAGQIGATLSGKMEDRGLIAAQGMVYQLRSQGRAEAGQTGQQSLESPSGTGGMAALAEFDASRDLYLLRTHGRGEAHGAGMDFCGMTSVHPVEIGLR